MQRLILWRHGRTPWNAEHRFQGQTDVPLDAVGLAQAERAAELLATMNPHAIVASDLSRAAVTAEALARRTGLAVEVDPDLRETFAGEWQGLTRAEIEQEYPGYLGHDRWPPGYEDHAHVVARARAALDRLHGEYEGADILVITHGGVIGTLEVDCGETWQRMPNVGGRVFVHHGDRLVSGERLVLVDDDEITVPDQI